MDDQVDQVKRLQAYRATHPKVSVLSPREAGCNEWVATWTAAAADPAEDGTVQRVTHWDLKPLLNYLEALDRAAMYQETTPELL